MFRNLLYDFRKCDHTISYKFNQILSILSILSIHSIHNNVAIPFYYFEEME